MASLDFPDLENGKKDLDHVAELATSTALTATDRLGNTKKTWAGIEADLGAAAAITATGMNRAGAEEARDVAVAAAGQVEEISEAAHTFGNLATDEPLIALDEDSPVPTLINDLGPVGPLNEANQALANRIRRILSRLSTASDQDGAQMLVWRSPGSDDPETQAFRNASSIDFLSFVAQAEREAIALGTSVVDCTASVLKAMNAPAIAGVRTKFVRFPRGRLPCNSGFIQIPDGVSLYGDGALSTIFDFSGSGKDSGLIAFENTGTEIERIQVRGSGTGQQPINTATPTLESFRNAGCGIIFAGVAHGAIRDCFVTGCGGKVGTGTEQNGVAGIWITKGSSNCLIEHNWVTDCRNGINQDNFFHVDPVSNKIIYNVIESCRFGIAEDSGGNAVDTLIKGNSVKSCLQSGIDLNKTRLAKVLFNYVWGNGIEVGAGGARNSGIFLYGTGANPCEDVEIIGNTCRANGNHGIKVGPYCYKITLAYNRAINNIANGIFLQGIIRHWVCSGNLAIGNGANGFRIYKPQDDANAVTTTGVFNGNLALQNQQCGVLITEGAEIILTGNIAKDNSQVGSNLFDGFRLEAGTKGCVLTGNHGSGALQRYAVACTDNESFNNIFTGNGFLAGVSGRMGFANLDQHWSGNGDAVLAISGPPVGISYPYGCEPIFTTVDNRLWKRKASGWVGSAAFT